jgi:membrane protein YqaA with SNARE-associated domain
LNTVKHILSRYTAFLWAMLKPLGIWGVFAAAALDGGAIGLPLDVVVGGYIAVNHRRWPLYVLLAAVGSALGSLVVYAIGYKGGEELLRKRVSAERFGKLHSAFQSHPFWSLMFPAMLPPPTPFKMFALAAAVAEMSVGLYLLAIFLGRIVRFCALAILIVKFGPGAGHILRVFISHYFYWVLIVAAVAIGGWIFWRRRRRRSEPSPSSSTGD